ncbi:MAG: hypothetical protein IH809_06520 [Proteobacteria bacterium]|nr:hypothetical protein [Pseudomonadota bacterium]
MAVLAAQRSQNIDVLLATTDELAASDSSPPWPILAAQVEYLAGDFEKSRQRLAKVYPDLFSENPEINLQRVLPATLAAAALKKLGETEQADRLLQLAQAIYESKWPDYQPSGVHYRLAELLAIKGDKDAAMRHLQAAYDEGFRLLWTDICYPMDGNPYFGELLADQRFVALVEKIRAHNEQARQSIVAAHQQREQA